MREIVRVKLENDLDLILAHKRVMKLCELTGFSLMKQTSIATAVSEISRCAIEYGQNAELMLGINGPSSRSFLTAIIRDDSEFSRRCSEAIQYAKRLMDDIRIGATSNEFRITLLHKINFSNTLTEGKLKSFEDYFKTEPPVSAYDELRRKNLLLQQLAEKMQRSENNFRILTDSLPLMMFSVNSRGQITYTNKWFLDYLGAPPKDLTSDAWKEFVHPSDFRLFSKELSHALKIQGPLNGQFRFLDQASRTFLWHIFSLIPLKNENEIVGRWIGYVVDINPQKVIEQTLKDNQELKETQRQLFENHGELQHKIIELNRSNYELEQFAHLASHDLQEPLRKLFYYSDVLKNKYSDHIDDAGKNTLNSMAAAAGRMKVLIADLLTYSQLQQQKLQFESVDLNEVIVDVIKDLDLPIKEKKAVLDVDHLPVISGNKVRLTQLFVNLIGNALKYSRKEVAPHIQILASLQPEVVSIKIRDNGIGFEEKYKEKIFELFERLHSKDEFPGTGIGLSICRKIAELHNGTISAISKPGEFSEFEVSLPLTNKAKSVFV